MNESNSIEPSDRTNSTHQTKFRLNEINEIENHFKQEIRERKLNIEKLSKYVAAFHYINCSVCNNWWNIYYVFYY